MGSENNGKQTIFLRYGFPVKGDYVGKRFTDIFPVGVYGEGGELSKVGNTQVRVSVGIFEIYDGSTKVQVCIKTADVATVSNVSSTKPYVVLRYQYRENRFWYGDFIAVSEGEILEDDLILGKALYSGATMFSNFDYKRRSCGSLDNMYAIVLEVTAKIQFSLSSVMERIRTLEEAVRNLGEKVPWRS